MNTTMQNVPIEFEFIPRRQELNPAEILVDVLVRDMAGHSVTVPAFRTSLNHWKFRFSASEKGVYSFVSRARNSDDPGLDGVTGSFEVVEYTGDNPLYRHGALQVAANRRSFEHRDGKPFFWLGDTWWMGLCRRVSPELFTNMCVDRQKKHFNVIQIVAGLYPDMEPFDPRGESEAGYPWDREFTTLNPAYFDAADTRIAALIEHGLTPCIVGSWGYFIKIMTPEKAKEHWRNLIARYGAYPVIWCVAGEGDMAFYLSKTPQEDAQWQREAWCDVIEYVRKTDPFHRLVTIHPVQSSRQAVPRPELLDFNMLQTGHNDRASLPPTWRSLQQNRQAQPTLPMVQSEVCYEGIGGACREDLQRWLFWLSVLQGAAGHTYGANGLWQANSRLAPYGASPHGMAWGHTPLEEALELPGSCQLGRAWEFLSRYPWQEFEPHPEWTPEHWDESMAQLPYTAGIHDCPLAGGIPDRLHFFYVPLRSGAFQALHLAAGADYRVTLFDPVSGEVHEKGVFSSDGDGALSVVFTALPWYSFPVYQDWVVVLERC